ncbi:MAG: hypothetical protein ABL887_03730 [Nitrosomonas sp.]|jgi:hypothetical protein
MYVLVSTQKNSSTSGTATVQNLDQNGNPIGAPSPLPVSHKLDVHPGNDYIFLITDKCYIFRAAQIVDGSGNLVWGVDPLFPNPICTGPQVKEKIS